MLGNKSGIFQK